MSRKFNTAVKAKPPLPTPDAEVRALLQQAIALHQQSRFEEAIARYSDILRINPVHFDAVHLLGVVADQTGNHQLAADLIAQAIAIKPNNAEAYFNRGNALKALNQLEAAVESYDKAIALNPAHASAYNNRGIALQGLDRRDEAIASYDAAIRITRDFVDAHYNRGLALQELKQFETAVESYDKAIALNPAHAGAYNNRGNALKDLTQFEAAVESYNKAISLHPDDPVTYYNRGDALGELRQFAAALASYDRAIALKPDFAEAYSNRGFTLKEMNRLAEAIVCYDKAIALKPDFAEAYASRGIVLKDMNRSAEAVESFHKAISLKPDYADTHHKYGNTLRELGRLDDARNAFFRAIELDPADGGTYYDLANSWKFTAGDRYLDAMEKLLPTATGADRMHLDFALGKAYEDTKDYRRSFAHLLDGNAARRAAASYDETATFAAFDRIEQVFTPELVAAKAGGGEPSARPIFVLGMPRSGTTLVEQLLASHPAVHGAGELVTLSDLVHSMHDSDGKTVPYPEFVPAFDQSALGAVGADYVRQLAALAPDGERVTDKMPGNFTLVGMIHLALPNAVIIHTMRNPVDTCVSCFSKLFSVGQHHTYDLGELGRYYVRYHRLMDHWRRVLPPGRILDVRYEEVVADLEGQARRMLAHCGLPWDERCLAFHQTDRPVRTASASQVRQPIYKTAVGRWHAYKDELAPLLSALGPLAGQA